MSNEGLGSWSSIGLIVLKNTFFVKMDRRIVRRSPLRKFMQGVGTRLYFARSEALSGSIRRAIMSLSLQHFPAEKSIFGISSFSTKWAESGLSPHMRRVDRLNAKLTFKLEYFTIYKEPSRQ